MHITVKELRESTSDETGVGLSMKCHEAANEVERLNGALVKIAQRYPCETADDMSRLAREAISSG